MGGGGDVDTGGCIAGGGRIQMLRTWRGKGSLLRNGAAADLRDGRRF